MSYGIGSLVEVITSLYLGRWIYPYEKGIIEGRHVSPAGREVYDVRLTDGKSYTLAPSEIEEVDGEASPNDEPLSSPQQAEGYPAEGQ